MTDLNEDSLRQLRKAIREHTILRPTQIMVSEEGLSRMKALCADDPEFRKRVLAEFPHLEGVL